MSLKVETNLSRGEARVENSAVSLQEALAPAIDREAVRRELLQDRRPSPREIKIGREAQAQLASVPEAVGGIFGLDTTAQLAKRETVITLGKEILSETQIREFRQQWEAARGNGIARGTAAATTAALAGLGGGARDVVDGIRKDPGGFIRGVGVEIGMDLIGIGLVNDAVDATNTAAALGRYVEGIHNAANARSADEAVEGLCLAAGGARLGGQALTSLLLVKVGSAGARALGGGRVDVDADGRRADVDADGRRVDVDPDGRRVDKKGSTSHSNRGIDLPNSRISVNGGPTGSAHVDTTSGIAPTTPSRTPAEIRFDNYNAHQEIVQKANEQNFRRYQSEQLQAAQRNQQALNQKVIDLDTPITIVTRPSQNFSSHGNTSQIAGSRTETTTLRKAAQGYEEGKITYSDAQGAGLDVTSLIREARDSAVIQSSMNATYSAATGKYDLNNPSVRASAQGKYPDGKYETLGKPPEIGIEVENGHKLGGQYAALKAQERDYNRLVTNALEINKANNPSEIAVVFMRDLGGGIAGGYSPRIPTLYKGTPQGVQTLLISGVADQQSLVDAGINGRMQDYNNPQTNRTQTTSSQTVSSDPRISRNIQQSISEPSTTSSITGAANTGHSQSGIRTEERSGRNSTAPSGGTAPTSPEAATLAKFREQPQLKGITAENAEALFDIIRPQPHYTGRLSPKYTGEMVTQAIDFGARNPSVPVYFVQAEVPSNLGALNKKLGPQDVNNLMTHLAESDQVLKDSVERKGGSVTITQGRGSSVNISISGLSQADAKASLDTWQRSVNHTISQLGRDGKIRNTDSGEVVIPSELRHPKNPSSDGPPEGINVRVSQLNPLSQSAGRVLQGATAADILREADGQLAWDFGNSGGRPAGTYPTGNFTRFSHARFEELKNNLDDLRSRPDAPKTHFKDTFEEMKDKYMVTAAKAGLSPGQAEQVYRNNVNDRDDISGALTADALDGTIGNAIKYTRTGKVSMMEIDVPNVGGNNAAIGMKLTDEILAAPAMIVERELRLEGIPTKVIRAGGDEFVILAECSPEKMREIASRAELEVAKLNSLEANINSPTTGQATVRVGDAEHPKHPNNRAFYGTGLYSGIIELTSDMTPASARKLTGDLVEKAKADKARASGEITH